MKTVPTTFTAVLLLAGAAAAADPALRLAPGGGSGALPRIARAGGFAGPQDLRLDLGQPRGLTAGPLLGWRGPAAADGADGHAGGLALGGFIGYAFDDYRVEGLVSGGPDGRFLAEMGAAYAGRATTLRVSLGTGWMPASAGDSDVFAGPAGRSLDFTLSVSHQITPSLHVGGLAAASRVAADAPEGEAQPEGGFLFGAGIGLRF